MSCPYDANYRATFEAVVLAVVSSGFAPRCAIESRGLSEIRIDRIRETLWSCRYSIHDLSRSRGEGPDNLARFNMPLELGIAIGLNFAARRAADFDEREAHDWMVLVSDDHTYQRFASDLAGFDPQRYDGSPKTVLTAVISWLAFLPGAPKGRTPKQVFEQLPRFRGELDRLRDHWQSDAPPWEEIVLAAERVAEGIR